ncbi:MAG: polymerase sigma-70 factor, subfamily [Acidobacteriota bacterium]|jgi:RNA polymerase sigma-70 factor (ECF subfamily)|nr:polymerase sigma-70 factor, subfamily [Acidobacteriota bacterium]
METDAQLVARALAGSQDAFRELVLRFERPVYSLIVRMVQDQATAEDLAQEAFVKAYRSLHTYDASRKLSSWLFKIAHNTTIDHLRRHVPDTVSLEAPQDEEGRGGLAAILSDASVEDPAAAAERRDMARSLERAISRLRPEYREAVVLFYLEGATYQEICDVTSLPLGTVKTNLHRARKELAAEMSALGWGTETGSPAGS